MERITEQDMYLFHEGRNFQLYNALGAHLVYEDGSTPGSDSDSSDRKMESQALKERGCHFSVWAPNAAEVYVIGDFNNWQRSDRMKMRSHMGIWEAFIADARAGQKYKYHIVSKYDNYSSDRADPMARFCENPPDTASIIWQDSYTWNDEAWMQDRKHKQDFASPISIYEVHLPSWLRHIDENLEDGQRAFTYREIAEPLAAYVEEQGFTHVELLPILQHPYYHSWGYQVTGFFSPASRYGTPDDLKYLIDVMHQHGIGVLLDWVPSHFPSDGHALAYFDGTHLYEHSDPRQGYHPDWQTYIFNFGRHEIRSFLFSSAYFWLNEFHIDGLRVDAVASMLYLDYSRKDGEWIANQYGGNENLEAIEFLKQLNDMIYRSFEGVQMIAEESTSWPLVTYPPETGGLGFGFKWDMGWMHDSLEYFSRDPMFRFHHQNELTFRSVYHTSENYILSLSHDEVVHGKGSLLRRMPGDHFIKFANLRLLFAWMYGQPGKKLIFMGCEFGQWNEWNHNQSLDWHLLEDKSHKQILDLTRQMNHLYRTEAALQADCDEAGFYWIDCSDNANGLYSFVRQSHPPGEHGERELIVAVYRTIGGELKGYRLGLPRPGKYTTILNTDSEIYGGNNGGLAAVEAENQPWHGFPYSALFDIPEFAAMFLKHTSP